MESRLPQKDRSISYSRTVRATFAAAKYTGLHALRHFYASWCNRKANGGLELPPMDVKVRMGHSSITVTMDVYGHLFPRGDDAAELAAAEAALFSTNQMKHRWNTLAVSVDRTTDSLKL